MLSWLIFNNARINHLESFGECKLISSSYLFYIYLTLNFFFFMSEIWLHCWSQVSYDTTGFLEKNRDMLHLDSIKLLSSCTCHLPQAFASTMLTQSEKPVVGALHKSGGADSQKLSVMTKFKVWKGLSNHADWDQCTM